jgi:Cytochrome C biogenesis protein
MFRFLSKKPSSGPSIASGETPAFRLYSRLFSSRILQAIFIGCLAITMLGAGDTAEKRFERVGHNMMCACGCGQILLECNHVGCPDSERMRHELQAQISGNSTTPGNGSAGGGFGSGGSDKQILDWFVAKYGATVLAAPLRGGFDNVAWIAPIALFLAAILGTVFVIRIWKSRTQQRAPLKIRGMTTASTDELRERIRRETLY